MYGLSDRLKPLSAAEEQVLLAVWDCPAPATRRDISEKLTATGWAPATAQLMTNPANPRTPPTVKAEAIHKKTFSPRDIFFRGGLAGCPAGWPYQGWPGWGWYQPWG